jgi:DNA polymerase-3 subunit epsilon
MSLTHFFSIDVETANPNMGTICQMGLVRFENGQEVDSNCIPINPETWFDTTNVSIHGIDTHQVQGEKTFAEIHEWLDDVTRDEVVVCHTHFDRVALAQACGRYSKSPLGCRWLDSARVSRRAWSQFSSRGYGLANVADFLGLKFRHHDALEDARTAGNIIVRAMEHTALNIDDWIQKLGRPIECGATIRRTGDGDGALVGERIVFTGSLQIPRREAADRAADAGGDVDPGVTKHTTLLVVGDQDIEKLAGIDKSSKHLKVEQLITTGQQIRIIGETDFMALCAVTS